MSLTIYLDDCAYDRTLVVRLQNSGHRVINPIEAGISGEKDVVHFQRAAQEGWVLLTKNPRDFVLLHESCHEHAGILLIYQDNNPKRDMSNEDIVRAITHLEESGNVLVRECHILNNWRY